jgi:hypothetical protein
MNNHNKGVSVVSMLYLKTEPGPQFTNTQGEEQQRSGGGRCGGESPSDVSSGISSDVSSDVSSDIWHFTVVTAVFFIAFSSVYIPMDEINVRDVKHLPTYTR